MLKFATIILFSLIIHTVYGQNEYVESTISRNNAYSFKTYSLINESNENVIISPLGVSTCMAMAYIGSDSKTQENIAKNMNFITQFGVLFGFKYILKNCQIFRSSDVNLQIGNALWSRSDIVLQKKYKNLLKVNFSTHIEELNFSPENDTCSKIINRWAKKSSNYNVLSLVNQENIKKEDELIYTNFITLNGNWENPFNEQFTNKDDFYGLDSLKLKVDFMNQTSYLKYNENNIFQIVELPYAGHNLSMVIILPKTTEYLDSIEKSLNTINFSFWTNELYLKLVNVSLPKFKVDFLQEFSSMLISSGLQNSFSPESDFTRISKMPVHLSKIIQKTSLTVEENKNGNFTEQILSGDLGNRNNLVLQFKANRPFLFIIKDNLNNSILMLGKVISPNFNNLSADYYNNN